MVQNVHLVDFYYGEVQKEKGYDQEAEAYGRRLYSDYSLCNGRLADILPDHLLRLT